MARKKGKGTELSVFKGREAKLNRAIIHSLALEGPQTIYDLHKNLRTVRGLKHTRYSSVNKRIRILKESGYVHKVAIKETKAGFVSSIYELRTKALLAWMIDSVELERLLSQMNDETALIILATLVGANETED